ncbi:MAG: hypothetical protein ACXVY8_07690 [Gaiellaceae bacterium]
MRIPRVSIGLAAAIGAAVLTGSVPGRTTASQTNGTPAAQPRVPAAATAGSSGQCRAPQQLALVSDYNRVVPAVPGSRLLPGWRVVCWPSRFYSGIEKVRRTGKWHSSNPNSGGGTSSKEYSRREYVEYSVLFTLKSASVGSYWGAEYSLARPRAASGFADVNYAASDLVEMTDSLCRRSIRTTSRASGLPALESGELLIRADTYTAHASAASVALTDVEQHSDSCGNSPTYTHTGRYAPVANGESLGGKFAHGAYEVMKGTKRYIQRTSEGNDSVTVSWSLKGLLEPATLTSGAERLPPSPEGGGTLRSPVAHLLAGSVDDSSVGVTENGQQVRKLAPGHVVLVVFDRSATQSFHLTGPGIDKTMPVGWLGTTTWDLVLKPGTYRFYSDGKGSKLSGSFRVS